MRIPAAPRFRKRTAENPRVSDRILRRTYLLLGAFLLAAVLIVAKALRIQWVEAARWEALANQERVYPQTLLADRGSILADDGTVLAVTLPFYRFAMDATVVKERDYPNLNDSLNLLAAQLAAFSPDTALDAAHFRHLLNVARVKKDRHTYLFPYKYRFTEADLRRIQRFAVLNRGQFKGGLLVERVNNKRFYTQGDLARITLGSLRDDTTGTRGLEHTFNTHLRGRDGKRLVQRVAGNVEVPVADAASHPAQDGRDVVTTLNLNFQDIVTSALEKGMRENEARHGVAILMEVETGDIKAIANAPENYNHAAATRWELGSIFKTATVLAALEAGIARPTDSIPTGKYGTHKFHDREMRDVLAYGTLTLQQALEKSSNIAIAKLIEHHFGAHPEVFIGLLKKLRVLDPSGVQLSGEPSPGIITPKNPLWSGTTLPWLAIGYNVRLTPLQMLTFYNSIANDGYRVRPRLVKEVRQGGHVVREFPPLRSEEPIANPTAIAALQRMLLGVVESGTAHSIRSKAYPLAGKSGTARKLEHGEYVKKYRASFVGYFPADKPKYSLIVVIDEPQAGEYYGGKVAAPIFHDIAEEILRAEAAQGTQPFYWTHGRDGLPTTQGTPRELADAFYSALGVLTKGRVPNGFVRTVALDRGVAYQQVHASPGQVPNVKGYSSRTALVLLENLGLNVRLRGRGRVVRQSLPPGTPLTPDLTIVLTLQP